jgi:3-oxoacyl-[acyl-carrier protein] reductase
MDLELAGKIACITGGTRGIGREIVLALAAEGCRVAFCARNAADIESLQGTLRDAGREAFGVLADVTVAGSARGFLQSASERWGRLDLLVLNAGASFGGGLLETPAEDWQRTFDLNVFHLIDAIRAAVPLMRQRGAGSIVVVSSISGRKPVRRRVQYAAAKAAAIQIGRSLALELASENIRVNVVSPGSILVPNGGWDQFRKEHPEEFRDFIQRDLPGGRLGLPQEVARVVLFLLSPQASWINGADIPVDGAQGRPAAY